MWGCGFGATTLAVLTRQFSPAQVAGLSAWYDPADMTTLFQDTAMTVPVTAPGQSVAAMRDKSGNGRHMVQSVAAARPVYGREPVTGRRNLLVMSENMVAAAWDKAQVTVAGSLISANPGSGSQVRYVRQAVAELALGEAYYLSVDVWAGTVNSAALVQPGSPYGIVSIDCGTGRFTTQGEVSEVSLSPDAAVAGKFRLRARFVRNANAHIFGLFLGSYGSSPDTVSFNADRWQVERHGFTAYQSSVTADDVKESALPSRCYLGFDGVDDSMAAPAFAWGSGAVTAVMGLRMTRPPSLSIPLEFSPSSDTNPGSFGFAASDGDAKFWQFLGRGSDVPGGSNATLPVAPSAQPEVITGRMQIASNSLQFRLRGGTWVSSAIGLGSGSIGTHPLNLGARNGDRLFTATRVSGLALFDRTLTDTETADVEAWAASNSKPVF